MILRAAKWMLTTCRTASYAASLGGIFIHWPPLASGNLSAASHAESSRRRANLAALLFDFQKQLTYHPPSLHHSVLTEKANGQLPQPAAQPQGLHLFLLFLWQSGRLLRLRRPAPGRRGNSGVFLHQGRRTVLRPQRCQFCSGQGMNVGPGPNLHKRQK